VIVISGGFCFLGLIAETRPLAISSTAEQMSGELKLSLQYHRGALTLMVSDREGQSVVLCGYSFE
jgi:hypothetical protein